MLQEQGRLDEALASYQQAIHYRPRLAAAYLNLGLVMITLNRRTEAEQIFIRCYRLSSSSLKDPRLHRHHQTVALIQLGRLRAERGDHRSALEAYRTAVDIHPTSFEPHSLFNVLGEAHFQLGDLLQAERWYRKSLQVKPNHVPAYLTLAKLFQRIGKAGQAQECYDQALSLAPEDVNVLLHYGKLRPG